MTIRTPTTLPDIVTRIRAYKTPQTATWNDNFSANVTAVYFASQKDHSYYAPKPFENTISPPGKIYINPNDATNLANVIGGIPYHLASDAIILHEMGHGFYATEVGLGYTTDPAKMLDWCFGREAYASMFVFNIGQERVAQGLGASIVPGVDGTPDLYATMLAAVAGLTPGSVAYKNALLSAAKAKFAGSTAYRQACTAFANGGGLPPSYFPPAIPMPPSTGGSTPAPVPANTNAEGRPKIPGGYWKELPPANPSD
ncbi:MAG: hypothetical protein ABIQ08_11795 [Duganella sp.]